MRKYKRLTYVFATLAMLLSNVMCAAVAYSYCTLQLGGQYAGYSAPADTAFLLCIPYGAGTAICAVLAWIFAQKHRRSL